MSEKTLTQHPEGKSGVNIDKSKYVVIREAILQSLRSHEGMTFKELTQDVRRRLEGQFDGAIPWYVTTVKLDLEARGVIKRLPRGKPQRLRFAGEG